MRSLLILFTLFFLIFCGETLACDCKATVNVTSSKLGDEKIMMKAQICAEDTDRPRIVSYLIFGDYRARDHFGKEFSGVPISPTGMITVPQGKRCTDDMFEVDTSSIGKPISLPNIKTVFINSCYAEDRDGSVAGLPCEFYKKLGKDQKKQGKDQKRPDEDSIEPYETR